MVGALLLVGSVAALFVALVLRQPYQSQLLPIVLLIPLGAAVAPKLWERPALGVAAIVALTAVPWRTGEEEAAGLAHVTAPDIAAAALVALVGVRTLVSGDHGRLRSWVVLPLIGIVVAGSAATLTTSDPTTSISGLVRYAEIFVVVPTATYLALQSRRDLKLILAVVIALGVFEGAVGVFQFFTGTGASIGKENARAVGTFGAYNIMSLSYVVSYALIAAAAILVGLRGGRRWWALLLVLPLLLPLAFSLSRGAWIGVTAGVLVVLVLGSWKKLPFLALIGGLAVAGLTVAIVSGLIPQGSANVGSSVVNERLNSLYSVGSDPDQSTRDRYALWRAAQNIWADHPVTGVGLKNFSRFRDVYAPLSFSGGSDVSDTGGGFRRVELLTPHNQYLLILAEQGFVGALAYGVLFLGLAIAGLRRYPKLKESPIERVFALASLGVLANYLINSVYGDIGGPTMVLTAMVVFGSLLWLASGAELREQIDETN